ncbi:hypothetical protein ANRL1_01569 [Anaerolineae bacterium]|nr:hypothetical protein ANRL1_01569 [Anaerolineae bacterium]
MNNHLKRLKPTTLFFIVVLAIVILSHNVETISAQAPGVQGPIIGAPVRPTSFNGDLRQLPKLAPRPRRATTRRSVMPRQPSQSPQLDPARQKNPAAIRMPIPDLSFKALDIVSAGNVGLPPDPNGDVNSNYYVQAAIMGIGIYNKITGTQLATATMQSLWSGAGTGTPCDTDHVEDPIVVFDTIAQRWIVSDMSWIDLWPNPSVNFYQCVAVSKTNDPITGGWWFYPFLIDTTNSIDYSRLTVWSDGYYMATNLFNSGGSFAGVAVWAMNRSAMINGSATSIIKFTLSCGGTCYASLLPSNLRGTLPPNGTPNFYASIDSPNIFHLWKFHVDWATPANSTFTGPTDLTVSNFSWDTNPFSQVIPQFGTTQKLQIFGDRLMMQLQYRNLGGVESLWANHSVYSGGVVGIRWYEIRSPNGSPTVHQQSTYQPDNDYRWMGSLAVDNGSNMALGYSASSASIYPAIRYAGRLSSDPLNTLGQAEQLLLQGTGPGQDPYGWGAWGDYSAMTVDPVDDCTFWYTSEYFATGLPQQWQTRVGAFRYPTCNPTPYPTNHTITFDGVTTASMEWNPNGDKLGTLGGIDYYATWDSTNLYVSMVGGAVNTNTYVVVVDTDSTNRSGSNTGATASLVCAGFNANGKGDLALARTASSTTKYQGAGGTWATWSPSATTNALDNGSNNVEFQLKWSDLGLPPTSNAAGLYLYVCNGTTLVSAWPPENTQAGANPVLNAETAFASNDSGRIPRTFGRHIGDEQSSISNSGSFSFLNGHVQLANVSGLATSCSFNTTVTGNLDVSDTTTIRRTYVLSPGSGCTGLTADLTLKYETGTMPTNAPDEKNGISASLHMLRNTGSTWTDQCSGAPACTYPGTGLVSLTGVNQFSAWTLGTGSHPTAVRLTAFQASAQEPPSDWIMVASVLGVISIITGGWRFRSRRTR